MLLKKAISCFLSLSFLLSSFIPAFAEGEQNITNPDQSGKSDVTATIEASNFDITVPLGLPLYLHADGSVTTATDAKIENNSQGPVIIKNVKLTPADDWKLSDFDDNYKIKKVNSKELGFKLMDEKVNTDGSIDMDNKDWLSIGGQDNLPVTYDGKLPIRSSNGVTTAAKVEFTFGWDEVEEPSYQNLTKYNYKGINYDLKDDGTASVSEGTYDDPGNTGLSGDITISNTVVDNNDLSYTVTSIGDGAFAYCYDLTDITIPNSVTSIGVAAFYYCTSLTDITIPDSVTSIGGGNFVQCNALINIDVNQNNQNYSSINGVLFNKNKTELIQYPEGKTDNTYIIPDSVTSIGAGAFYYCTSLTDVTIPDSVTSIGNYAFAYCDALTNVTMGNSVTSIGNYAFAYCDALTNVTMGNSVTSIGNYAFRNWESNQTINIEGKSNYQDTIDAGWDEYWNKACDAQINYLGNTQTSTSITVTPSSNYSLSSLTDITGNTVLNEDIKISDNQNINYTVHFTEI